MSNKNSTSHYCREALVEIAWGDMDYTYLLLTREETETKVNYYLFNKFKIFQKKIKNKQFID